MKLLKITFLIISFFLQISCDDEKSSHTTDQLSTSEIFEVTKPDFVYFIGRADFLIINAYGILNHYEIRRKEQKSLILKDCVFYKDVEELKQIPVQGNFLGEYFDFLVDGNKILPEMFFTDNLKLKLPNNAFKLEIKLKEFFRKEVKLKVSKKSKTKNCITIFNTDIFNVGNKKFFYGEYKTINKLKDLNINLKLTKGFTP